MLPRSEIDRVSRRQDAIAWFKAFYATYSDPTLLHDEDRVLTANEAFARLIMRPADTVSGIPVRALADEVTFSRFSKLILSNENAHFEAAMPASDGTMRMAEFHSRPIDIGVDGLYVLSIRDVTDRHNAVVALRESEARFRSLVQELGDVILVVDDAGTLKYANPALERVLGYPRSFFEDRLRLDIIHADDLEAVLAAWNLVTTSANRAVDVTFRARSADGRWIWLETVLTNHLDEVAIEGVIVNASDVTEQKRLEMDLRHLALHDPLTGLSNRARLNERLDERVRRLGSENHHAAVLFLDLDHFKSVNDTLGHAVGDSLLRSLAARIQQSLRPHDLLARVGGDEFVAVLDQITAECDALEVANRIVDALRQPFEWNGHQLILGSSIGVAMVRPGSSPEQVLHDADIALYHAKSAGRGRAVLFSNEMLDDAGRESRLAADLHRAVERGELFLEYQPIVRLSDHTCRSHEALLRWRHPELGLIAPSEFIPIAEASDTIASIGAWMLEAVCRQIAAWEDDDVVISLNLSPVQMRDPGLADLILADLRACGADPRRLQLELTESVLIGDLDQACATLERLRQVGVSVAIDDFGSGYSSLLYLRELPIDVVKLDSRFLQGLGTRAGSVAIVEAIVALAHTLGLTVTGEGIETAEQLQILREIGCDAGQGYYLAHPMPPDTRPMRRATSLVEGAAPRRPATPARVPRIAAMRPPVS